VVVPVFYGDRVVFAGELDLEPQIGLVIVLVLVKSELRVVFVAVPGSFSSTRLGETHVPMLAPRVIALATEDELGRLVDLVVGFDLTRLAKALVGLSGMMPLVLVGLEPKLEALVGISLVPMQVLVLMELEL
jgi:hypothetical protein